MYLPGHTNVLEFLDFLFFSIGLEKSRRDPLVIKVRGIISSSQAHIGNGTILSYTNRVKKIFL